MRGGRKYPLPAPLAIGVRILAGQCPGQRRPPRTEKGRRPEASAFRITRR
jgi:hypothetical protein